MTNIIQVVDGKLVTNSLILSREFGKRHGDILRSIRVLIEDGDLLIDDFLLCSYTKVRNKSLPMYTLTERGLLIVAPFLSSRKSKKLHVELIHEYLIKRKNPKALKRSLLKIWFKQVYWKIKRG